MLRCLIFDLGQTILRYDIQAVRDRLSRISRKSKEDVGRIFFDEYRLGTSPLCQFDGGRVSMSEFVKILRRRLGISSKITRSTIRSAFINCFELPEKMPTLLALLKDYYTLGILSNISPLHWAHAKASFSIFADDSPIFSFRVLSFEEKLLKPSYTLFVITFARARRAHRIRTGEDLRISECLFLDDLERNIEVAENFGMQTIRVDATGIRGIAENLRRLGAVLPPLV